MHSFLSQILSNQVSPVFIGISPECCYTLQCLLGVDEKLVARTIRGQKASNRSQFFNEMGAALQFPSYFGENFDAADECLNDLTWLGDSRGYVFIFTNADKILSEESPREFDILVEIMEGAVLEWREKQKISACLLQVHPEALEALRIKLANHLDRINNIVIPSADEFISQQHI